MSRRARQRGFSLTELLVSLLLLTAATLTAAELWDHSLRLLGASGRSLAEPSFAVAATQLRADLQAALELRPTSATWSSGPLELVTVAGDDLRWERRGPRLVRTATRAAGAGRAKAVAQGVTGWRWREVAPGLVEVEVRRAGTPPPTVVAGRAPNAPPRARETTEALLVAARGRGGRSW